MAHFKKEEEEKKLSKFGKHLITHENFGKIVESSERAEDELERKREGHIFTISKTDDELAIIKEKIKKIKWEKVSDNWTIIVYVNQNRNKTIVLDPHSDCSKENPLYKHKAWLERVYYDEEFDLTQRNLAKICGITKSPMNSWFQKYDIPKKEKTNDGLYFSKIDNKLKRYIPEEYFHPQLKPFAGKYDRAVRYEHDLIMETHLAENTALIREKYGVSESCLLEGKYLDNNYHVHHINYDPLDNNIENLWLYENNSKHQEAEKTLNKCLSDLIKLGQIKFHNGEYYFNKDINYREDLNRPTIENMLKPIQFDPNDIFWEGGWKYIRYKRANGYIFIKISDNYGNPTAMTNRGFMREYRYIAERILARDPVKNGKYLIDGTYLKPKYKIHHVNLDPSDNRVENLWLCESQSEHKKIEKTLHTLVKDLLNNRFIAFIRGKYYLNY